MSHATRSAAGALLALPLALLLVGCAEQADEEGDGGVELVPGQRSEAAFPDASVQIASPARGAVVDTANPPVSLRVRGFELGAPTPGADTRGIALSGRGQHVHLILDNRPYQAIYDTAGTIGLADAPLDPGVHVLRAFASRQWHESVKSPDAFAVSHFFVGDTTAEGVRTRVPYAPGEPLLTYSRPKGTYEGPAADSVMVDFYVTGAELGPDGHRVRLTVDGTTSWTIERWAPHYLLGLSDGEHRIRIELLSPDLEPIPGDFNSTERTITVRRGGSAEGTGGAEGY